MKEFPGLKILAPVLIPVFFCACAVDRPPTGGPPDHSPLSVVSSLPAAESVNASPQTIRIGFSHYVSSSELSKSIFFSPLVDDYEVTMHGRDAEIRLYQPLQQNRTYTLTLRAPLISLDGGHQLDRSWTLPFSTGPVINQGSIEGRVWTYRMAPARNITVMAYPLARTSDTPQARPDYIAQTGPSGVFRFENLAPASYRIVAITDRNGNLQYDHGMEMFAVTSSPAVQTGTTGVGLRLAPGDRSANTLRSCRTINSREIEIAFNEPIPARSFDLSAIRIENSSTGAALPVLGYYSSSRNSEDATFRLLTAPMESRAWYKLRFTPAGGSPSELTFAGNPRTERYPELSVAIVPASGADNVIPETIRPESGASIELQCNLPVEESSLKPAITLSLSDKGQDKSLPFAITRIDSRTYDITPSDGFLHAREYRIQVRAGLLKELAGSASKEPLVESRFETAGQEAYGEVTGDGTAKAPAVVVEARQSGSAEARQRVVLKPKADGAFSYSFRDLPAGEYTITGFIPSASGAVSPVTEWNSGSLSPFAPCDPFAAVTVTIRPGWTTDNVRLDIPAPRQTAIDETAPRKKH
ncbi:MAG: Ig-like domain-containing protein [Chlorobaculum sp.]|nr:Ig-like domain-containing protein [Chlorobaculum sp.]